MRHERAMFSSNYSSLIDIARIKVSFLLAKKPAVGLKNYPVENMDLSKFNLEN